MSMHRACLIFVTLGLAVLGAGTVLSAPVGPSAWQDMPSSSSFPASRTNGLGSITAPAQTNAQPVGASPDGTFLDAQSQAGAAAQAPALDRTRGLYYPGIYMARDWRSVSKADYPMLVGGHDTFTWRELEQTEGNYNWTRLDNMILANASSGKKTAFGISTYNGRIENGIQVPDYVQNNSSMTIDCGGGWKIPRYWNSTYQTKYRNLVQALANRYKNDDRVAWVQIGVGLYGEIQPSDNDDDQCIKDAMLADGLGTDYAQTWINTINQIIDIFMTNFNTGKPVFLVYTPSFVNTNEKCYTTLYGAGKYNMGLFAGGVYSNQTDIFTNWPNITYPYNCSKWDPIVYWNWSPTATVPIAIESYGYMLPSLDAFYWGVLNALNKHPDYLNLESDLFYLNGHPYEPKTENFPMMYFANQYLGKTMTTTPNAWIAMREYDPATNGFGFHNAYIKPQYGNYNFWLYQDQDASGGHTMTATTVYQYADTSTDPPTTRVDHYYDPLLVGKGPQGSITRRTNHSAGQDYMYLDIDDDFVALRGIQHSALITVTWFDVITSTGNTWFLQYKDTNGSLQQRQVQRNNTHTWQTTTFSIHDANFNNGLNGDDFRIYDGGVADVYVHFVAVGPAPASAWPFRELLPTILK
jgi:hypothetical protein